MPSLYKTNHIFSRISYIRLCYSLNHRLQKSIVPLFPRYYSSNQSTPPASKPPSTPSSTPPSTPSSPPSLSQKIKNEINHYVHGSKLLAYEVKISTKLLSKQVAGYDLTRRERIQLKRTTSDILRLVPFSAFVIIPFAELLLPIALKLFPNLLPSTYESKKSKNLKRDSLITTRKKTSQFLHNTLEESKVFIKFDSIKSKENKLKFYKFFKKINDPSIEKNLDSFTMEEISEIARFFKNDTVLDNLSRPQLVAMAKFMSIIPFGNDNMLRSQIRRELKRTMNDDKIISYEGVNSLSKDELNHACVSRGIKAYGVPDDVLSEKLRAWLFLRLHEKIPSVLMVLSATFTFNAELLELKAKVMKSDELLSKSLLNLYYEAILKVLSSIPDPVYNITKLDVSETPIDTVNDTNETIHNPTEIVENNTANKLFEDQAIYDLKSTEVNELEEIPESKLDDNEFKLNVLKEQEEMIKKEQMDKRQTASKQDDLITLDEDTTPSSLDGSASTLDEKKKLE
ncbi:hypothetical protein TBLA_0A04870 [Henningerozyma blattae CBS 6284]|uniref:Letm1 RBD domain-containing protein n=1 Tax=Henningerozyma blattae (strain ATCC 34711 / CBS 6284 / DSM 70876 / NBRC 10599 / NRRL Y-10934 / UCD 77-7) TaxID=1071380 RepID=I2GVX8_HENB6|nr:hypothetical protein TBLA_0A04870 [Tetrapisispora blattae CBS 6284]CCH58280.1 hypothetical protein TBLA_0A04870 [Tetrapisispora blattae CBS 6284]